MHNLNTKTIFYNIVEKQLSPLSDHDLLHMKHLLYNNNTYKAIIIKKAINDILNVKNGYGTSSSKQSIEEEDAEQRAIFDSIFQGIGLARTFRQQAMLAHRFDLAGLRNRIRQWVIYGIITDNEANVASALLQAFENSQIRRLFDQIFPIINNRRIFDANAMRRHHYTLPILTQRLLNWVATNAITLQERTLANNLLTNYLQEIGNIHQETYPNQPSKRG